MSKYESREHLAGKITWEGGLWQWATGYGFNPEDMPDEETAQAAKKFEESLAEAQADADALMTLLPDVEGV